jgi:hypothetical protein
MLKGRMQQLFAGIKVAEDRDFIDIRFPSNLPSSRSLKTIPRENSYGCSQNAISGKIDRLALGTGPFRAQAIPHASTYLHHRLNASTYLHRVGAVCGERRTPKFWLVSFGQRKNQSLFLFLPVRKCGFCSRGITVFINSVEKVLSLDRLLSRATICQPRPTAGR